MAYCRLFVASMALVATAQAQPMRDRWPGDTRPAAPATQQAPAEKPKAPKPAGPPHAVACEGAFAKASSHLQLATVYGSENLTFTDVDGPEGSKIPGSVLFPNDPKRRLEVIWNDAANRRDTQLVDINGRSTWTGPKGLKLGMALIAIEKLNGKPFKLLGFGGENGGMVQSWNDGALDNLAGGCKLGLRFAADPKAPDDARSGVAEAREFGSNDAVMRAVKPKIVEILIGYP